MHRKLDGEKTRSADWDKQLPRSRWGVCTYLVLASFYEASCLRFRQFAVLYVLAVVQNLRVKGKVVKVGRVDVHFLFHGMLPFVAARLQSTNVVLLGKPWELVRVKTHNTPGNTSDRFRSAQKRT